MPIGTLIGESVWVCYLFALERPYLDVLILMTFNMKVAVTLNLHKDMAQWVNSACLCHHNNIVTNIKKIRKNISRKYFIFIVFYNK